MELLETTVWPGIDRETALEWLIAEDAEALFAIADSRGGKVSACDRLVKTLSLSFQPREFRGTRALANYLTGFIALDPSEIATIVKGVGQRFPCEHGWLLSTSNADPLVDYFDGDTPAIDQNSFLPNPCKIFTYSEFGRIFLEVQSVSTESVVAREPLPNGVWRYVHASLSAEDAASSREMVASVRSRIDEFSAQLAASVKTNAISVSGGVSKRRVTLSTSFKRHAKNHGYRWNKTLSEPKHTICDKVTDSGNIIRLSADAGGHANLIPYLEVHFISHAFTSPKFEIACPKAVTSTTELEHLLRGHSGDLRLFEDSIVPVYESVFPRMDPEIRQVFLDCQVRAMIPKCS